MQVLLCWDRLGCLVGELICHHRWYRNRLVSSFQSLTFGGPGAEALSSEACPVSASPLLGPALGLAEPDADAISPYWDSNLLVAVSDFEELVAALLLEEEAAAALLRFFDFLEGEEPEEAAGLGAASAGARKSKRPSGSILLILCVSSRFEMMMVVYVVDV